MADTTQLVMAGQKMAMPRFFKRLVQAALAVAVTAGVLFVVIVGNGFLVGRGRSVERSFDVWLAFIQRSDILTTMGLTALVSVVLVYWLRDNERKAGGRPSL